jgi:hypothetical protein
MMVMALDHTRDFFGVPGDSPTDLLEGKRSPVLQARWITNICAPVFFLLPGTGSSLSLRRRSRSELSRFLFTRGLWLIFLEGVRLRCLVVQFNFDDRITSLVVSLGSRLGRDHSFCPDLPAHLRDCRLRSHSHSGPQSLRSNPGRELRRIRPALEHPPCARLAHRSSASPGHPRLPAHPVDPRHRRGFRARGRFTIGRQSAAAHCFSASASEPRPGFVLLRTINYLWRQGPVDSLKIASLHRPFLPQLQPISALAALSPDDARARASDALGLRAKNAATAASRALLRQSPTVFLWDPPPVDSPARSGLVLCRIWPGSLDLRIKRYEQIPSSLAAGLGIRSSRHLSNLDIGGGRSLPSMPLLGPSQAAAHRPMAQLFLKDSFRPA